jgi:hypothetical protein
MPVGRLCDEMKAEDIGMGIDRDVGFTDMSQHTGCALGVVVMTMGEQQGIHIGRGNAHELHIVEEGIGILSHVNEKVLLLISPGSLHVKRDPMLAQIGRFIEDGILGQNCNRETIQFAADIHVTPFGLFTTFMKEPRSRDRDTEKRRARTLLKKGGMLPIIKG